ncbi:hypothetical protein HCN44_006528 [Aphidius gifuensis]|uniref:Peroxidase n=1 Tax=Aphidius gifuensis TaxID=684658 RepID=A0A834Y009_APHGI|nr:hypothetical protein HCN44_006528 [Aphidius gifuensis]
MKNKTNTLVRRKDGINENANKCGEIKESPCPPSMYRTPTGTCNNIRYPSWGSRGSPYLRFLPPAYSDGMSRPRQSISHHSLPSPMEIIRQLESSSLHKETRHEKRKVLTSITGLWAELILRDISSPITPHLDPTRCCQDNNNNNNRECYTSYENNGECKPYYRNVPTRTAYGCKYESREQMNGATGYLDGSDIYGNTDDKFHMLRLYENGKINITQCQICQDNNNQLGNLYKILLNEHNRIVNDLKLINPHWNDAKLFWEGRRALVAQIQRITFVEFLSGILGEFDNDEFEQLSSGYYRDYSSHNKPGVYDAIALVVLPALASLSQNTNDNNISIENQLDKSARGITLDIQRSESKYWNTSALLIHKSRDFGIPSYKKFVDYCSNNNKESKEHINYEDKIILDNIYMNYDDVDLLIGGILEKASKGSAIGPTFGCLLKQQLLKLRNSDRFWYENDIPPSSLTPEQLTAIRRTSFSGLLCANTKLERIQPMAFLQSDAYLNAKIDCQRHGHLDLSAWKENNGDDDISNVNFNEENQKNEFNHEIIDKKINNNDDDDDDDVVLSKDIIEAALEKAKLNLIERRRIEYNAWLNQKYADPKSPAGTAASFSKANKDALLLANSSILYELATNELLNGVQGLRKRRRRRRRRRRQAFDNSGNSLGFPGSDFSDVLQNVDISNILPGNTLPFEADCPDEEGPCDPTSPYRTFTGHCNNLRNPKLGKSLTTFARLLPPVYDDGVSQPRIHSVRGNDLLPNPRTISTTVHPDISNLHNRYTLMTMQFAQFIDHDLTMTPIHKGFAESIPTCRSCDSARTVHPECNPFPVPAGDHFYPTINVTSGERMCFPSMRSLPGQQNLGPREQVNQNTAFLDCSVVYGENNCVGNLLRGFSGRMNVTNHPSRRKDLLPQSATHPECKSASGYCFVAGDARASEQPGLTVIHTIWVREHNRVMEGLQQVNPQWNDEKLFQETRRILSAMLQHITYNEFIPRILGWNAVSLYGLKLLPQGYYNEYSADCNPSIVTEFAAAAFRIGHSLLRPHLPRMDKNYRPVEPPILLRDGFFNVDMLYQPDMIDEMIRGLVATPMETLDQFITGEVTNHLFENRQIPFSGIDLIALNIQRARDHGIPGYNHYRGLCNLKKAQTFDDLSREMTPEVIARLKRIYASVDDIDLFPGGMSERPLQGGLVGPTFGCIIATQFRRARKCDRFWYETDDPNIRFTEQQLNELRKNTLAKVLCENMDSHVLMQRAAFDLPSDFLNPRVSCGTMAKMDFASWKETRDTGCQIGDRNVAVGQSGFPTPCTSCICTNEGTQCASLRVTDCNRLIREASREAILRDDVCTAQCGFALATTDNSRRNSFNSGPSSFGQNNAFKFPDLSQFLG